MSVETAKIFAEQPKDKQIEQLLFVAAFIISIDLPSVLDSPEYADAKAEWLENFHAYDAEL